MSPSATFEPKPMAREGSRSELLSFDHLWEVATLKGGKSVMVERDTGYAGEAPSFLSFFYQWPLIILRYRGSVLPFIFVEVLLSIGVSVIALHFLPDETYSPIGHQLVGTLLAFLVVFRSNISWGMYTEGRSHVGQLIHTSRVVAIQMIEDLAIDLAEKQSEAGRVSPAVIEQFPLSSTEHTMRCRHVLTLEPRPGPEAASALGP